MVILYRPNSPEGTLVDSYTKELSNRNPTVNIETVDVDGQDGSEMAKMYDIVRYPAVMVLQSDGSMSKLWQDENLPLIDEVISYAME